MERILLDLFQNEIYHFLSVGDLLELGQVNRHFRNDTEDYFDQYQHGRKEGYFHLSCKLICFHDPLTLACLLLNPHIEKNPLGYRETRDQIRRDRAMRKLFFFDEWPNNDHTATEVVRMLDHIHATSWRSVCLRLLDRIRAIKQRENIVLDVEPKIPNVNAGLSPPTVAGDHRKQQLGDFCKSQKPIILAYFVVGSGFIHMFNRLCSEKGLSDTDVVPFKPNMFTFLFKCAALPFDIIAPAPNYKQIDIQCNIVAAEYGPAGFNPQSRYEIVRDLLISKRGYSRYFNPHFLVWGVPVFTGMENETPYKFKSFWQANRAALMEFVFARGCSCKVLLVLVELAMPSLKVSAEQVDNQLGLSYLSKFGIQCRIQMCQASILEEPRRAILQGGAQGFEWAVSQFV